MHETSPHKQIRENKVCSGTGTGLLPYSYDSERKIPGQIEEHSFWALNDQANQGEIRSFICRERPV
jgi:hypothetical protein